jgi:serine/threonine protein kinase
MFVIFVLCALIRYLSTRCSRHISFFLPVQVGSYTVPREVALLLRVDHQYIIHLLDYFEDPDNVLIVMEKPDKYIDLFDYITQKEVLSEKTARHIFR